MTINCKVPHASAINDLVTSTETNSGKLQTNRGHSSISFFFPTPQTTSLSTWIIGNMLKQVIQVGSGRPHSSLGISGLTGLPAMLWLAWAEGRLRKTLVTSRSEERRVGKEC